MSHSQRTIEHLLKHGILSPTHADAAATHLGVYPNKRTWLTFFDKALLIIGTVALVLSLVFFVAYNWQNLGKMGKFALVEGALVITIFCYVALVFKRRFQFIRQLLLLIASIITGSLLALFGQVYQTGADTWQLFFVWALLITPWVIIARFPALWLLWLGLINACLLVYFNIAGLAFIVDGFQDIFQVTILALVNLIALYGWLISFEYKRAILSGNFSNTPIHNSDTAHGIRDIPAKSSLHWSTYVIGLASTCFTTYLALITVWDDRPISAPFISLILWLSWCVFMLWQFYQRRLDLLMLTYLAFSLVTVVVFWASRWLLDAFDEGGFLVLALLLIGISSAAVVWLRKVAHLDNKAKTNAVQGGANHE